MFVGADGIDATNGITTFNEGYAISSVMAAAAHKVIAVLDASKFNRRGFNQVLPMAKIDCVITDEGIVEKDSKALKQTSVELIVV
jgi:DeoR family galactitol utilization operon repressor